MAKRVKEPLTAKGVESKKEPGYYADGGGLYLRVSKEGKRNSAGVKTWAFLYTIAGRAREMGLGPVSDISLAEARDLALELRKQIRQGIDPIDARQKARDAQAKEESKRITFADAAKEYIDAHRAGWKNAKHADQWTNTIATYAAPTLAHLSVADIDTGLVVRVLKPIWETKTETASRLRGRIESVLNWAATQGYRASGDNPARWHGHLENLFPKRSKAQKVQHHSALPFSEVGDFIGKAQRQEGIAALALEFTILTACRTGESIGATWGEIDLEEKVWTIPAERMKAENEHRIPLSGRVLEILKTTPESERTGYVFPGAKAGKPLSNMAMLALLARMKRDDLTVHGFRSTFRDWAGETTAFPREVIEHALAHKLKDKAEAAYARGTLFDKRRLLMDHWSAFCATTKKENNVVEIKSKAIA